MLDTISLHIRDFAASRSPLSPTQFSLLDECLLEGLVLRVWQAWSNFCRGCIIESCIGTTTAGGRPIIGLSQAATEEYVSGAAIQTNQNRDPATYWSAPNSILKIEPTWGDGDVLVKVLTGLRPSNVNQLLAALQIVINAWSLARTSCAVSGGTAAPAYRPARTRLLPPPIGYPRYIPPIAERPMQVRLARWGNSLGLRIPKEMAAQAGAAASRHQGRACVRRATRIVITPARPRYALAELLEGSDSGGDARGVRLGAG